MSNRFHSVSALGYVNQFKCISADCPDTCCAGWRVDIDKTTFKKIKSLDDSPIHKQIKSYFKVNPAGDTSRHALIELEPTGRCPALDESQLCTIQSQVGEDYLSKTCQLYPRQFSNVGDTLEMHLYLSCPEAARLCLQSDTSHAYTLMELKIPKGKSLPNVGGFRTKPEQALPPQAFMFWQLRNLISDLITKQAMPLWELVLLVGFLCEKLQSYFDSEREPKASQIELLILQSKLFALDGTFHEEVESILPEERVLGLRALYVQVMTNERTQLPGLSQGFIDLVAKSFEGYNSFMKRKNGIADHLWSEPNEYIQKALRNYLINEIGLQVFPRLFEPDLLGQWRNIVIKLSLVNFYLNGLREYYGEEFSMDHCVALVQKFSKAISHSPTYLLTIDKLMKKVGIDGIAGLGILAR
jgi:lysine-N-methylase